MPKTKRGHHRTKRRTLPKQTFFNNLKIHKIKKDKLGQGIKFCDIDPIKNVVISEDINNL